MGHTVKQIKYDHMKTHIEKQNDLYTGVITELADFPVPFEVRNSLWNQESLSLVHSGLVSSLKMNRLTIQDVIEVQEKLFNDTFSPLILNLGTRPTKQSRFSGVILLDTDEELDSFMSKPIKLRGKVLEPQQQRGNVDLGAFTGYWFSQEYMSKDQERRTIHYLLVLKPKNKLL